MRSKVLALRVQQHFGWFSLQNQRHAKSNGQRIAHSDRPHTTDLVRKRLSFCLADQTNKSHCAGRQSQTRSAGQESDHSEPQRCDVRRLARRHSHQYRRGATIFGVARLSVRLRLSPRRHLLRVTHTQFQGKRSVARSFCCQLMCVRASAASQILIRLFQLFDDAGEKPTADSAWTVELETQTRDALCEQAVDEMLAWATYRTKCQTPTVVIIILFFS